MKLCILIPFYNHHTLIGNVLEKLDAQKIPCVLVDDGSCKEAVDCLQKLSEKYQWLTIIHQSQNLGKGAAVLKGFAEAQKLGFSHALQIDADGQHDINDIPKFAELAEKNPQNMIVGQPVYDVSVPRARFYGRCITHFWVMIETLSFKKIDTMCGFRIYPLLEIQKLLEHESFGRRMDFDIEIIVKAIWQGIQISKIETKVLYPEDGVSHFHFFYANLRISFMHTRLFFGMLWRAPKLLWRKL